MLLCNSGNKSQKSKYMTFWAPGSLEDKVLSYDLVQVFITVYQSTEIQKLIAVESLLSLGRAQLGGRELGVCLLLAQHGDNP